MIYVAAMAGLGIARILTLEAGDGRELGALTPMFEEQTVSRRIIRAFYPRTEQVPAKVSAFLDFLSQELARGDHSPSHPEPPGDAAGSSA